MWGKRATLHEITQSLSNATTATNPATKHVSAISRVRTHNNLNNNRENQIRGHSGGNGEGKLEENEVLVAKVDSGDGEGRAGYDR